MKIYKTYLYALGILAGGLLNTSCADLLTEDPNSYYEKKDIFSTKAKAAMAVTGVYERLPELYGYMDMAFPCSDDTYYVSGVTSDKGRRDIAHYKVTSSNTWVNSVWQGNYTGIERANYTVEGIEGMADYEKDKELQSLVGEAKFLRALYAFNLVRYWGDVPFKTTSTNVDKNVFQPRCSREIIYDQIIDDLNFAKTHLSWATPAVTPEKITQGAARGLLMRVLLQRAGYSLQMNGSITRPDDAKRKEYFEAVIEEWEEFKANGYHDFYPEGYRELFKGFSAGTLNSVESIFEIAFYSPDGNTGAKGYWGTYIGPLVAHPGISVTEVNQFMGRANAMFRVVPEWKGFFDVQEEDADGNVITGTNAVT